MSTRPFMEGAAMGGVEERTRNILIEHRNLLHKAADLKALVEKPPRQQDSAEEWYAMLVHLLSDFVHKLSQHFTAEAETTMQLKPQNPQVLALLQELDAEHASLLVVFARARSMASDRKGAVEGLQRCLLQAISAFSRHEAKEDALFREMA